MALDGPVLCADQLSEVCQSFYPACHDLLCLGSASWLLEATSVLEKGLLKQSSPCLPDLHSTQRCLDPQEVNNAGNGLYWSSFYQPRR